MKRIIFPIVFLLTFLYSAIALAEVTVNNVRVGVHTKEHLRIVVDTSEPAFYNLTTKDNFVELKIQAVKGEKVATTRQAIASNQVGNSYIVGADNKSTIVKLNLHEAISENNMSDFVLRSKGGNGTYRIVVDIYNRNPGSVNSVSSTAQPKPAVTAPAAPAAAAAPAKTAPAVSNRPTVSSSPIKKEEEAAPAKPVAVQKPTPEVKQNTPKPATVSKSNQTTTKTTAAKTTAPQNKTGVSKQSTKKKEAPKPVLSQDGKYTILRTDDGEPYFKSTKAYRTGGGIKGKLIVLDPGHGGSDPGAIGKGGTQEKIVTLQIANRLKENLEKAGAKVIMTRTTDKDVTVIPYDKSTDADELQARINIAEKNNADILVSLHNNSLNDRSVGGICTYYFNKTANDAKLAGKIQDKLGKGFQLRNMGIRQANFYMVKRCSMPAALIELCFISNAQEEKLLKNTWFQKKTAKLITEAVADYFK